MAVGGALLKIGPFSIFISGGRCNPQKEILNMLSTAPAAVVEPKEKSQNPGAKAKRLKGLLESPDFAEAVDFGRSLVKKYKQCVSESADVLVEALPRVASSRAIEKQIEGKLEFYKGYTEQLKENKELNKAVASMERSITTQSEVIEGLQRTNRGLIEILELSKKARNPKRVTGGKRGRPQGSKSKAVAFGAEAMPDNDLVTFGTAVELEAAFM
jgi:hypothetical protein